MSMLRTLIFTVMLGLFFSYASVAGQPVMPQPNAAIALTPEQAQAIALGMTGGGTLIESKIENKYGTTLYEYEILNNGIKYEIKLDATGAVREFSQNGGNLMAAPMPQVMPQVMPQAMPQAMSQATPRAMNMGTGISMEQAQSIALSRTGGGTFYKARQDYDDGRSVYEFEIFNNGRKYEVDVDMAGNIVKFDIDD